MTLNTNDLPVREKTADDAAAAAGKTKAQVVFGRPLLKEFLLDPAYRNLNQGSFGTLPRAIQSAQRAYQDRAESRPDQFIRYEYPRLLDESRRAAESLLRAPPETVVFVANATVAANTVLKNLAWDEDGRDEILYFSTIYGGCGKTVDYVVDYGGKGLVSGREVGIEYPIEDEEVVRRFRAAVAAAAEEGKRPVVAIFDTVSSMPGVRFPFEAMVATCKELGILSLVDGAQGAGLIDLNLAELDPDFFFTNLHKWLHVPRGCAAFYVPPRNQGLIKTSLATSHGYVSPGDRVRTNPMPTWGKTRFVTEFEFVGTVDNSPYLAAKDAIKWREGIGGEEKIREWQTRLAREGGKKAAEILGTEVLDNKTRTLTECGMVNVALPMVVVDDDGEAGWSTEKTLRVPRGKAKQVHNWMLETLVGEYHTFIALLVHQDRWWARLSAQVYLDMDDFEWAGKTLLEVVKRADSHEVMAGKSA
ncbi:pyridoxal phosphate-dependent transferase [Coniochaeta sp. 2T2.1]|nr:pyridoxal phosphate-dependent transferase [Coniochaeta sp. 2T2.1]